MSLRANYICLDTYSNPTSLYNADKNRFLYIHKKSGLNIYTPDTGYIKTFNDNIVILHKPLYDVINVIIISCNKIRSVNYSNDDNLYNSRYNNTQYKRSIITNKKGPLNILPNEIIDYIIDLADLTYDNPEIDTTYDYFYKDIFKQIKTKKYCFIIDFNDRDLACSMFSYTLKWRPTEIVILSNFDYDDNNLIIKSYTINDNSTPVYNTNMILSYKNIVSIKLNALYVFEKNKCKLLNI